MTTVLDRSSKKFAVLIGINYFGTSAELNGCINDVTHLKKILIEQFKYTPENILALTDDSTDNKKMPNKQNIINSLNLLVDKAVNDGCTELWLSYSGHGYYRYDVSGDEDDHYDEVICPVDYATSGMIADDFIYSNLVKKLPSNVTLFCLMDCCHSGTILDLPYLYKTSLATNNTNKHDANVISISGCRDDQTSADAYMGTDYEGAMTWSFLKALYSSDYNIKLVDLVKDMRSLLVNDFTQVPMLAVSSTNDIERYFIRPEETESVEPLTEPVSEKPIKFTMKVDYWYWESSWNVLSLDTNKYVFDTDKKFSSRYQQTETVINLKPGQYKLRVKDTYGDGGVTSRVEDGSNVLVSASMTSGRLSEYTFDV